MPLSLISLVPLTSAASSIYASERVRFATELVGKVEFKNCSVRALLTLLFVFGLDLKPSICLFRTFLEVSLTLDRFR